MLPRPLLAFSFFFPGIRRMESAVDGGKGEQIVYVLRENNLDFKLLWKLKTWIVKI